MKPYYQEDGITIYHGNCRELLPEMLTADLLLTDPPYGLYQYGGKWGHKNELLWDKQPAANLDQLLAVAREQIIWGGNYFVGLPVSRGWLVWHKPDSVPSAADAELAWTSRNMNTRLISHSIAATNGERVGHPTQKPLRVMKWSLSFFPEARNIVDPYLGSGTSLLAAKELGLKAIGIEIEERYCEIAAKRLSQGVLDLVG